MSPILIDAVGVKSSAASLTLRNRAATPANIQLRLFRWRQQNGTDVLEPTDIVSVSPPFANLAPGAPYVIRVVRTATSPVAAEESYRLLIDELPAPGGAGGGSIQLAVRYSLPVFFRPPGNLRPSLSWSATLRDGQVVVTVQNGGGRRARIANLHLTAIDGTSVTAGAGLAGYALAHAAHSWNMAAPAQFNVAGAMVEFVDEQGAHKAALTTPPTFTP